MFTGLRVFAILIFGFSTFALPVFQTAFADEEEATPPEKDAAAEVEDVEKEKQKKKKKGKKRDCIPSGTRIPRC